MKKLRVAFLLDELTSSMYTNEIIDFVIQKNDIFERPAIITGYKKREKQNLINKINSQFTKGPFVFIKRILISTLYRLIQKIETPAATKKFPNYKKTAEINGIENLKILEVDGTWSKSQLFVEIQESDVDRIAELKLDCIIRCGTGILRGRILTCSKFGVLSFHHGDNRTNRGGPSGFWEVINREPSSGFIIQRLNDELDGGTVLVRGNIMTESFWSLNSAQLLEKSNVFMKILLEKIATNGQLPAPEGIRIHSNQLYRIDTPTILIKYIYSVLFPAAYRKILSKLLSPKIRRWSIAYLHHKNFTRSLWRHTKIKNPKGRFLADPFVFKNGNEVYIFVEDLCYTQNKGRISAIKIDGKSTEFIGVVLEEDFHLSFPFVFEANDQIYMIPESSKNNDIRLYKCIEFPKKWEFEQQLMSNIDAADSMLFYNHGTWFLLTNICSANIGDHQSELHIFYSDDFKTGNWTPIGSGNPVIFDPLKSRNGGFFPHNGRLYRVNQVPGFLHYGQSFSINEIEILTKDHYSEKPVSDITANFVEMGVSTHHFNANETVAVMDYTLEQSLKSAKRR